MLNFIREVPLILARTELRGGGLVNTVLLPESEPPCYETKYWPNGETAQSPDCAIDSSEEDARGTHEAMVEKWR